MFSFSDDDSKMEEYHVEWRTTGLGVIVALNVVVKLGDWECSWVVGQKILPESTNSWISHLVLEGVGPVEH